MKTNQNEQNKDSEDPRTNFLMRPILILFSIAILTSLIYSNTLHSPFIFDDYKCIEGNPTIRLNKLSIGGITKAAFENHHPRRYVANISFALNFFFHKYELPGYHIINILIHITTAFILLLLLQETLKTPVLIKKTTYTFWIPVIAAIIWVVHPLHIQSVTYIVQRMNSLAAMFYIISLLLYVKGRSKTTIQQKYPLFAASIISGILAMGSKENAFTLPFFILLYEWYFFQDLSLSWIKRKKGVLVGLGIICVGTTLFIFHGSPLQGIISSYSSRDFNLLERLMTESRVVIFYISLLFFPHPSRLNLDHHFSISHSLIDPTSTLFSIIALLLITFLSFFLARKERLISFGILWFLGNLLMESSVIGLEIIFEHRTYLSSMFFIMPFVLIADKIIKVKHIKIGLMCFIVALLSLWTYERNSSWRDEVTLWRDCAKKSPQKPRAQAILANALERRGDFVEAAKYYSVALSLNPQNAEEIHYNLGNVFLRMNKLSDATNQYRKALEISPENPLPRLNLGIVLKMQGRLTEAFKEYSELLRIRPSARAHNNMGDLLMSMGFTQKAVPHFMEALRLRPNYSTARNNLYRALQKTDPTKKLEGSVFSY